MAHLLGSAGRAHHEAVGGPNPRWAEWYAEHLVGDIDEHVGFSPSVEEIAGWLREADARHKAEASEKRWPAHYAEWILDSLKSDAD